MKVGTYYLFKSDLLVVQTDQQYILGHGYDTNSWNLKVAIRFGSTAYIFAMDKGKIVTTKLSDKVDDSEITIVSLDPRKDNQFDLTLGDGSQLKINGVNGFSLDISLMLAPKAYKNASGLCYEGCDANIVDQNDDMFLKKLNIPTSVTARILKTCSSVPECKPYVPPEPVKETTPANQTIPTPQLNQTTPPPVVVNIPIGCKKVEATKAFDPATKYQNDCPQYKPVALTDAKKYCEATIPSFKLDQQHVNRSAAVSDCTFDIHATGNLQLLEASKVNYHTLCRGVLEANAQSGDPTVSNAAKSALQKTGLGADTPCPQGCGNGVCTANACSCNTGYTGDYCEKSLAQPEQLSIPSTPTSGALSFSIGVGFFIVLFV